MSKAILVLDEMPNNCGWCKLCDRLSTCMPTEYTIPSQDLDEGRPDWCPLKEVPNYVPDRTRPYAYSDDEAAAYNDGWNDCLKEIMGDDK